MQVLTNGIRNAIGNVSGITRAKSPAVILQNIQLSFDEEGVMFYCTDLETSGESWLPCTPGDLAGQSIVVNCQALSSSIRKMEAEEPVNLKLTGSKLIVSQKRSRYQIPLYTQSEMPSMQLTGGETVKLPAVDVATGINLVIGCCSETRHSFTQGVIFDMDGSMLSVVATDGTMLGIYETVIAGESAGLPKKAVCIPHSSLASFSSALNVDEEIEMTIGDNRVMFRMSNSTYSTPLLSVKIPDWRALHPAKSKLNSPFQTATVDLAVFKSSLENVRLMTDKMSLGVRVEFGDDEINFSTRENESGSAWASCFGTVGEFMDDQPKEKTCVDIDKLRSMFRGLDGEQDIEVSQSVAPDGDVGALILRSDKQDWHGLIMPMRWDD